MTLIQPIEGLNVSDLGWGAAGAATVTLSFWVRSSLTGTFGGSINNSGKIDDRRNNAGANLSLLELIEESRAGLGLSLF